MTVTPALTPSEQVIHAARRIQAQGYPLAWQEAITGAPITALILSGAPFTRGDHLARLTDLAAQLGETMAQPSNTLTADQIAEAANEAAAAGYYPPAAYDENGDLIDEALPGHAWSRADAIATIRLRALRMLWQGMSNAAVARTVGVSRRSVERWRKKAHQQAAIDPDWTATARDVVHRFLNDEDNPTALALSLGILEPHEVPTTHPARTVIDDLEKAA